MIWHHNDYSEEAINEMRKEAEERIKEMQSRTRLFEENKNEPTYRDFPKRPVQNEFQSQSSPLGAISEMLGNLNGDRLIIVAIMWLLWTEHADSKLLLALAYILM